MKRGWRKVVADKEALQWLWTVLVYATATFLLVDRIKRGLE